MRILRFRITDDLYKKYKVVCAELELSIPKQGAQLIENFVQVQQENIDKIKNAKKGG